MNSSEFITYDQLKEQIEEFNEYGWSRPVMEGFVKHRLILGFPDRQTGEYRYHSGDVAQLLSQKMKTEAREDRR